MPVPSAQPPRRSRGARIPQFAAALALLVVCWLAAAGTAEAKVPRSFFGLSAVKPTPNDFKGMRDIGAGSYRIEIAWPSVQGAKNRPFAWAGPDDRFRRAATYGLRPVPIIFGAPGFITGDSKNIRGPVKGKKQRREWMDFAAAALDRYGPNGKFWLQHPTLNSKLAPRDWLVWNEQNARAFWHPKANPKHYAALLRITRQAFDKVDPSVKMTVGGMFGFPQHKKAMDAEPFLRQLYKQKKARKIIDGVSVHPYATNIAGVKRQTKALRRVMDRAGDRKANLWVGETGWASAGPKRSFLVKTKKQQAKLLSKAYKLFLNKRKAWNIKGVFWFTWRDYKADAICNWCPKAGLLNQRSQLKPSGKAYQALINKKTG